MLGYCMQENKKNVTFDTSSIFGILSVIAFILFLFFLSFIIYLKSPYRECDHYSNQFYTRCVKSIKKYGCYVNCNNYLTSKNKKSQKYSRKIIIENMENRNYSYDCINKTLSLYNFSPLSLVEIDNIEKGLPYYYPEFLSDCIYYKNLIKNFIDDEFFRSSLLNYYRDVGISSFFRDITTYRYVKVDSKIRKMYLYSKITKQWTQLNYNIKLLGYHRIFGETISEGSGGYNCIFDLENVNNSTRLGAFTYFILHNNLYAQNNFTYKLYIITLELNEKLKITELTDLQIEKLFPNTKIIKISQFKNNNYDIFLGDSSATYFLIDDYGHYKYNLEYRGTSLFNENIRNLFSPNSRGTIVYGNSEECKFYSKNCYYINVR